jgi:hypothetical protein
MSVQNRTGKREGKIIWINSYGRDDNTEMGIDKKQV